MKNRSILLPVLLLCGCAAPEPADQDYPDPGALSCIETWQTSQEIVSETDFLGKLGSGEPLDTAITASRLKAYRNKLDACEAEFRNEPHVDGFRKSSVRMKLHDLETYAQENPYSFDS